MKHSLIRLGIAAAITGAPLIALAGASVTFTAPMTASGGTEKSYTVSGSFDSLTISNTGIDVTMLGGNSLKITSPDSTIVTFPSSGTPLLTESCSAGIYSVEFTHGSGGATKTFTITPSTSTCGGGGSGGGSGGGGGGGGGGRGPTPAPAPAPAPAPTPAPTPAPAAFNITSDLTVGASNNEVAQLQAYLATDKSLYPEGLVTGYFGPATQRAVKRFQEKQGLPSVGRVGPATRAKLAEVFAKTAPTPAPAPAPVPTPAPAAAPVAAIARSLAIGSRGNDVSTIQSFLANDSALYPEGTVSGYFGPATQRAVKRFQEKHGIAKAGESGYGSIGPKTRAKLNELLSGQPAAPAPAPVPAPAPTPAAAAEEAKVKALLDQLKALQDQLNTLKSR